MAGWPRMRPERVSMARPPSPKLVERALALIVECESAPAALVPDALAALQQWCGTSPEHAAAAQEAQRLWGQLAGMTDGLKAHFTEQRAEPRAKADASAGRQSRQRRHLLLSAAALLGTGGLAAGGLRWYWLQPVFTATYVTPTAQTRRLVLPDGHGRDGSQLDMAPRSALDVALFRERREVRMGGGEVRFDVAHDPLRPFTILTRQVRIEVVGTVFTVRDRGGPISVGVERGHVRVQVFTKQGPDRVVLEAPIDLLAGQSLGIEQGHATVRSTDTTAMSAWREGWLVFNNARLGDALESVNAYRRQPILSRDPRVAAMRLSGRFQADDATELLAVLPTILPLAVHPRADGSVELTPR